MIYLGAYQFIKDLSVLINLPLGFEKRRHLTRKIVASDVSDKIANDSYTYKHSLIIENLISRNSFKFRFIYIQSMLFLATNIICKS